MKMLPVWPLVCSTRGCNNSAYPRAVSLEDAYAFAAGHRWTIAVYGGERPDLLLCPRCSFYPPSTLRRSEIVCPPTSPI